MEGWPSCLDPPKLQIPAGFPSSLCRLVLPCIPPVTPRCSWLPLASLLQCHHYQLLRLLVLASPAPPNPSAPVSGSSQEEATATPGYLKYPPCPSPPLPPTLPGLAEHPIPQALCLPSLLGHLLQGPSPHPQSPQPHQHRGVPMRPCHQQFFTTRFYFSFLLTKNIEELYIVGGQLGSPFGSKRAAYVTTPGPRAWGMKAEHLPPTLPQSPAPHLGCSAIPGGQQGGTGTASPEGTAELSVPGLPHLPSHPEQPLRSSAGL